jgi:hypothetical protein
MLKKQITYKDLDDVEQTEEWYFALNKAEIAEMELSEQGGLVNHLQTLVKSENGRAMIEVLKDVILRTVGERSADGKRFVKTEDIRDNFLHGGAYPELFMELASDPQAAADFFNNVIPKDLAEKVAADEAEKANHTALELLEMDQRDFDKIAGTDIQKMSKEHLMVAFQRKAQKAA